MSDLISRQDAIEALIHEFYSNVDDYISEKQAVHAIDSLPSAQPNLQPTCNQLATDCISRAAAIDAAVEAADEWDGGYSRSREEIITLKLRMLPSAEPKRGKWIDAVIPNDNGGLLVQVCDQCNTFFPLAYTGGGHHFCPNCGADMRGGEDNDL